MNNESDWKEGDVTLFVSYPIGAKENHWKP